MSPQSSTDSTSVSGLDHDIYCVDDDDGYEIEDRAVMKKFVKELSSSKELMNVEKEKHESNVIFQNKRLKIEAAVGLQQSADPVLAAKGSAFLAAMLDDPL